MLAPIATLHYKEPRKEYVAISKTEEELLQLFNNTGIIYEPGRSILTLFKDRVNIDPDAIAIVDHQTKITYHELDEQSNQIAHFLLGKGVAEESCVPVCTQRTKDMIAALLGVLKAGGAYVPIDPDYPESRIQYQIDDVSASVVITDAESRSK